MMHRWFSAARLRVLTVATGSLLISGCFSSLEGTWDILLSPSAAGNLLRAPYVAFVNLIGVVTRLGS